MPDEVKRLCDQVDCVEWGVTAVQMEGEDGKIRKTVIACQSHLDDLLAEAEQRHIEVVDDRGGQA
jgi:hypothetical protein